MAATLPAPPAAAVPSLMATAAYAQHMYSVACLHVRVAWLATRLAAVRSDCWMPMCRDWLLAAAAGQMSISLISDLSSPSSYFFF